MLKVSDTVKKLFRDGKGYRCEAISSGRHEPSDVARYEIEELGNDNEKTLAQYCDGLELSKKNCSVSTIYWILETEYDGKYDALWLTTKNLAKKRYCDPGEYPKEHIIPSDSKVIQDLDEEGGLFLIDKNWKKKRIAEICELDNKNQRDITEKKISKQQYEKQRDKLHKEYSELTDEAEMFREMMKACEVKK